MIWDIPPKIWLPAKPAIIRPAPIQKANFLPGMFPFALYVADTGAFPVVETTAIGNTLNTSFAVPLPSGIVSGNLLIVLIGNHASAGAVSITTPSGWTLLFSVVGPDNLRRGGAYYRVANGSEGSTQTFSASANCRWATNAYRISGYTGTPESVTVTGEASAPNPPSLSPSWGTAKTLWLAVSYHVTDSVVVQSAPTDYTNIIQQVQDNSGNDTPRTASARRELEASSEDPGTFGASVNDWVAATIAVQGT